MKIKKHSFQNVYPIWEKYIKGNFPRQEIGNITRHSKYIISILHQFEGLLYE